MMTDKYTVDDLEKLCPSLEWGSTWMLTKIVDLMNQAYKKGYGAGRYDENNLLSKALYPREYREK